MTVERYPNLKEEVGGSILGFEISSLLDKILVKWSTASYALALAYWTYVSKKKVKVKWSRIFLQSWTSTRYFSNSTGSSGTNCRFSLIIAPDHHLHSLSVVLPTTLANSFNTRSRWIKAANPFQLLFSSNKLGQVRTAHIFVFLILRQKTDMLAPKDRRHHMASFYQVERRFHNREFPLTYLSCIWLGVAPRSETKQRHMWWDPMFKTRLVF